MRGTIGTLGCIGGSWVSGFTLCFERQFLHRNQEHPEDRVGSSFEASQLKHQIVSGFMKLNFVRYRAFWGRDQVPDETARVWNPLAQPWLSFVESGLPGEGLVVFEATQKLNPPLHAHSSFLLEP